MHRRGLAVLLLVASLPAQTFIVDVNNGPGTNFTQIAAAVPAVPDGSTLLVRAGSYMSFAINGKGLTILCDPGVAVTGAVTVNGTLAQQSFVLRALTWPTTSIAGPYLLELTNCAGPVLLEGLVTPLVRCIGCARAVNAANCRQLMVRSCSLGGTTTMTDCVAVIEGGFLAGDSYQLYTQNGGVGLDVTRGVVQAVGTTISGGDGLSAMLTFLSAAAGIIMVDADLRLVRGSVSGGMGYSNFFSPPAVFGFGTANVLRVDPGVVLRSAPAASPIVGVTPQVAPMPALTSSDAAVGGNLVATVSTLPGDLVALLLGMPGPPTLVPGFRDAFWLDPTAYYFDSFGVQQAGAPITSTKAVPNLPQLQGLRVTWQAVCNGPVTGWQATNPSVSLIR